MIPIFIGYDKREAAAYHVCTNSIIRHATSPISLNPLSLNLLNGYEEKHSDGSNYYGSKSAVANKILVFSDNGIKNEYDIFP